MRGGRAALLHPGKGGKTRPLWKVASLIAVSTPLTFLQAPLHIKKAVIANDGLTLHGMPAVPHNEPEQLRLAVDS